jgi:hypothetical protein
LVSRSLFSLWVHDDEMRARLCLRVPRTGGRLLETGTEDWCVTGRWETVRPSCLLSVRMVETYPCVKKRCGSHQIRHVHRPRGSYLRRQCSERIEELSKGWVLSYGRYVRHFGEIRRGRHSLCCCLLGVSSYSFRFNLSSTSAAKEVRQEMIARLIQRTEGT